MMDGVKGNVRFCADVRYLFRVILIDSTTKWPKNKEPTATGEFMGQDQTLLFLGWCDLRATTSMLLHSVAVLVDGSERSTTVIAAWPTFEAQLRIRCGSDRQRCAIRAASQSNLSALKLDPEGLSHAPNRWIDPNATSSQSKLSPHSASTMMWLEPTEARPQ